MEEIILTNRSLYNNDWATILFLICTILLAVNRQLFYVQFNEFIKLPINDKYIKIYKEPENLKTWFTVAMYIIQIISFSFLIQLALAYYGYTTKENPISYIRIITVLNFFILSKFLFEKIISNTFDIQEFEEQFNLYKVYHRTYLGLLSLPLAAVLYYNDYNDLTIINTIIIIFLIINLISYLNGLRIYKKIIFSNFFYFILYLCALEIAPYFFMYYFFTKS